MTLTMSDIVALCCADGIVPEVDAQPRESYRNQEDKQSFIEMLVEGDQGEQEDFMGDEFEENSRTR